MILTNASPRSNAIERAVTRLSSSRRFSSQRDRKSPSALLPSGYGYQWWTEDDGSYNALGIFGQAKWEALPRLTLTGGASPDPGR